MLVVAHCVGRRMLPYMLLRNLFISDWINHARISQCSNDALAFFCRNDNVCIKMGKLCNGINDCGNNQDESDSICEYTAILGNTSTFNINTFRVTDLSNIILRIR